MLVAPLVAPRRPTERRVARPGKQRATQARVACGRRHRQPRVVACAAPDPSPPPPLRCRDFVFRAPPCPASEGGAGVVTTVWDNETHASTVTVADPTDCHGRAPGSYTRDGPYTLGAISTDWTAIDPTMGSNAMITGTYDPAAATPTAAGAATAEISTCERVMALVPMQLGRFARTHSGLPVGRSVLELGTCRFSYTIRWSIPLPPEVRAARVR